MTFNLTYSEHFLPKKLLSPQHLRVIPADLFKQWSRARRTSASTYLHESVFHSFETDVAIPTSLILKIESCIGCHLWINGKQPHISSFSSMLPQFPAMITTNALKIVNFLKS